MNPFQEGTRKNLMKILIICWLFSLFCFATESKFIQNGGWPLGLEQHFFDPVDNPITSTKVLLGKQLFFDKRLSKDESVSCAVCHDPTQGFSNGKAVGDGVFGRQGNRNVPSIINRLFGQTQFWDGRSETLESQALGPLLNPNEMAINESLLVKRLGSDMKYQKLFQEAFNATPTLKNVSQAIAAFERTLLSGAAPFDRYEWNGEKDALSASAKRGLVLFRGKARCSICHIGTNFTDEMFHNLGAGEGGWSKRSGTCTGYKGSSRFW